MPNVSPSITSCTNEASNKSQAVGKSRFSQTPPDVFGSGDEYEDTAQIDFNYDKWIRQPMGALADQDSAFSARDTNSAAVLRRLSTETKEEEKSDQESSTPSKDGLEGSKEKEVDDSMESGSELEESAVKPTSTTDVPDNSGEEDSDTSSSSLGLLEILGIGTSKNKGDSTPSVDSDDSSSKSEDTPPPDRSVRPG